MSYGRRASGPWYGEDRRRALFERNARAAFPGIRCETLRGKSAGRLYRLTVEVPYFEDRRVRVIFRQQTPSLPVVTVDGPTDSPHRYGKGELCIWYPKDDQENRWVLDDGLPSLIGLTIAHLFREAYWRLAGEWLGPEAGHGDGSKLTP